MKEFCQKNKEVILAIIFLLGLSIWGIWYFYGNKINPQKEENKVEVQEKVNYDFGEFNQFLRKDLTPNEVKEVNNLIGLMQDRIGIARNILDEAYRNGDDMEEAYRKVDQMKELCLQNFQPYLREDKKEDFRRYINDILEEMESYYSGK